MPHTDVPAAGGAMPAVHFIEITPRIRRTLEALVDDLILLLDEVDGDVDQEPQSDDDSDTLSEHGERDDCDSEWTANETYGGGFLHNFGPREDDAEDGGDAEQDDAERGLGDADAVALWFQDAREMGVVR